MNYVEVMRQMSLYSRCFALRRMDGGSLETKYIVTLQVPSILSHLLIVSEQSSRGILKKEKTNCCRKVPPVMRQSKL